MDNQGHVQSCMFELSDDFFSLNKPQIQGIEKWVASVREANPAFDPNVLAEFLLKLLVADPFFNARDLVWPGTNVALIVPTIRIPLDIRTLICKNLDTRGNQCAKERASMFVLNRVTTTRASELFGHASFVSLTLFQ